MSTTVKDAGSDILAVGYEEAARMLGISIRTLHTLAQRGEIKTRKVGRRVLFPVAELKAFLARGQD